MLDHSPSRLGMLVVCAMLLCPVLADAQPQPPSLPLLLDAVTDAAAPIPGHAVRAGAREGRFNNAALMAGRIRVTLADGRELEAVRQHDVRGNRGNFSWVGEFEDAPGSLLVVTSHRGVVSGMLHHESEVYELGIGRNGRVVLYQVDEAQLPEEGEPIHVTAPAGDDAGDFSFDSATMDATAGDNLVMQDLLVVYTPKAVSRAGSVATLESRILNAVAAANAAYVNSQVHLRLNVVGLAQTNYTETGDMGVTLSRLRGTSDGYMDEVHTLRNQTGADLVALISEDSNYCGIAYVMSNVSSNFASSAFSVTRQSCFSNQTFAHELGHNQGNAHDRANGGNAAHPYAYGYRTCDNIAYTNGQSFRTVMAYSCSGTPRVNYFSNPNVYHNGAPMGVDYDVDPSRSSDNARSMNMTAAVTAGFRSAPSPTPPTAPDTLTGSALAHDRVAIAWSDRASNEDGFVVDRAVGGSSFSQRVTLGANATAFTDTGLVGGTTYHYRVRAYNSAGASGWTAVASVTTPQEPIDEASGPVPPASATVAISGKNTLVSWTAVSGATGYDVRRQRKDPATGKWISTLIRLGATTTTWSDTLPDGIYRYPVRSVTPAGKSLYTIATCSMCRSDGSFTIEEATGPVPPASATVAISGKNTLVSWTAVSGATAYDVRRQQQDPTTGNWSATQVRVSATTTTSSETLPTGTYRYDVRSSTPAGGSTYTLATCSTCATDGSFTIEEATGPVRPASATVAISGKNTLVSWTAVSGATGYDVRRQRKDPATGKWISTLIRLGATTTAWSDTLPDGIYRYPVRSVTPAGKSLYTIATCSTCASDGSFTISTSNGDAPIHTN